MSVVLKMADATTVNDFKIREIVESYQASPQFIDDMASSTASKLTEYGISFDEFVSKLYSHYTKKL